MLGTSPARRLFPLVKLAAEYAIAAGLARLLAACSSLLLVRAISVEEYGFYTILLSAFTFIGTSSDLGITESLAFFRRRARRMASSWAPAFLAVMAARRTIFLIVCSLAACYVVVACMRLTVPPWSIAAGAALLLLAAWSAIGASVRLYALRLEQRFRTNYVVESAGEIIKLLGAVVIWHWRLNSALLAMFFVGLAAVATQALSRRFIVNSEFGRAVRAATPTRRDKLRLFAQVAPILPGTIYFSLQGPVLAWLAAAYGTLQNVAEIGALGRIGALIGIATGFTVAVIVPRLSAVTDERAFRRRYFACWGFLLIFGAVAILLALAFPEKILLILGPAYAGLRAELVLAVSSAVAATWSAFVWQINRLRGWVKPQRFRVPVLLAGQMAMFSALDFSSAYNVLLFGVGSALLEVGFQTTINLAGFARRKVHS